MIDISDKQWNRLWEKVERPPAEDPDGRDKCWSWRASASSGIPQMFVGNGHGGGLTVSVRRVVWEQTRDEIVGDQIVTTIPSCTGNLCVNPNHLVLMTRREFSLRNGSPTASNAAKTHCKNGHELTEENVYVRKDGRGRQCRVCSREGVARHRRKHKGGAASQEPPRTLRGRDEDAGDKEQ